MKIETYKSPSGKSFQTIRKEFYIKELNEKFPGWTYECKEAETSETGGTCLLRIRYAGKETPWVRGSFPCGFYQNGNFIQSMTCEEALQNAETVAFKNACHIVGVYLDEASLLNFVEADQAFSVSPKTDTNDEMDSALTAIIPRKHINGNKHAESALESQVQADKMQMKLVTVTSDETDVSEAPKEESENEQWGILPYRHYYGTEIGEVPLEEVHLNIFPDSTNNSTFDQLLFEINWEASGNEKMHRFFVDVCGVDEPWLNTNPKTGEVFGRKSAKHYLTVLENVKQAWTANHPLLLQSREAWNTRVSKHDKLSKAPAQKPVDSPLVFSIKEQVVANDTISESAPTESISNTDESPVIVNESQPVSAPLPNNLSVETDSSESTGVTIKKEFKFTPVDKIARSLHDSSVVLEYIMDNTSISDQESFNKVINVISNRLSRSYTDINHFCEWASEEEIDTFVNYANKM